MIARKFSPLIDGYRLSCPPQCGRQVRNLFSPEVADYFSAHRKYALEGSAHYLIVYEREQLAAPGDLEHFVNHAMSIFRLFTSAGGGLSRKTTPGGKLDTLRGVYPAALF
jgi:hypothetical protein